VLRYRDTTRRCEVEKMALHALRFALRSVSLKLRARRECPRRAQRSTIRHKLSAVSSLDLARSCGQDHPGLVLPRTRSPCSRGHIANVLVNPSDTR
jgi:hypothetical protein